MEEYDIVIIGGGPGRPGGSPECQASGNRAPFDPREGQGIRRYIEPVHP